MINILDEHVFYSDEESEISIGSSLLKFENKIYATNQLVSFEVAREPFKPPTLILILFLLIMFIGIFNDIRDLAFWAFIFSLLIVGYTIFGYIRRGSGLTIRFSSNEQEFIADDSEEITKIREALKNAIIFKG